MTCKYEGDLFAYHFHELYLHDKYSNSFKYHCKEMQALLDGYKHIICHNKKSLIDAESMITNFFIASYDRASNRYKYFITFNEDIAYEDFYIRLLLTGKLVYEIAMEAL